MRCVVNWGQGIFNLGRGIFKNAPSPTRMSVYSHPSHTRFTDEEKNVLRFGFVIVDDAKRGMGYGKQMLQLAIQYAFSLLKVETITLGVFEKNASAYYCYKSVGFRETGQMEDYVIAGETWKCIEMELRKSWVC